MNQQKIGGFLKRLRKETGMTQEQLAEQFSVSSRTVSRWETGSNMPDVSMLVELADFYNVDIREIIDGERKSEMMDKETKDTLKKVAEYATEKEKGTHSKVATAALMILIALYACTVLFGDDTPGLLYGIVPEDICDFIFMLVYLSAAGLVTAYLKIRWALEKPSREVEKSVVATVVSKEVKSGTHETGRSVMGYSFVVNFLTADGQTLELYAYEIEFGSLKEGMNGILTYKGRYFVGFSENKND